MKIFPDHLVTEFRLLASIAPTSLFFVFFFFLTTTSGRIFFTNYLCPSSTEISTSRGSKNSNLFEPTSHFSSKLKISRNTRTAQNLEWISYLEQNSQNRQNLDSRTNARIARISTLEPMLEWNPPVELAVFILHLHVITFSRKFYREDGHMTESGKVLTIACIVEITGHNQTRVQRHSSNDLIKRNANYQHNTD